MKIAFVAAAESPHTIKWANALTGAGHEVAVFSMPDQKDQMEEMDEAVRVVYLDVPLSSNGARGNARQLRQLLSDGGYDAVVAMELLSYGVLTGRARANNLLMVSDGLGVFKKSGSFFDRLRLKGTIRKANGLMATAANIITHVEEAFGDSLEQKMYVVPFGVDMERFVKQEVEREDIPTFGSVKFLEEWNHVDLTLEAYAKFKEKHEGDARLKIVGLGSQEQALRQKAEQLGIAAEVEFMGYVSNADLPAVLNTMDALLQMTMVESFGVSAIEAMACSVPVIASDTNGAAEYILDHVTGYLIKAGNTDVCADRMVTIAKDRAGAERLGDMARGDVEQHYDLKDCLEKMEEVLHKVAGK